MKSLDLVLSLLLPSLVLLHLVVAPYTKVEESFNIQATYDVLVYGTPTSGVYQKLSSSYDHFSFPGVVPRTFIGPVLLAGVSQPIVAAVGFHNAQLVVRAVLGLFNAACLLVFRRNLGRAYGAPMARWYLLLQASQFHVMFYASRTLPNMFAFGLTTLAFSFLVPHPNRTLAGPRQRLSIALFVFAAVIFRSEIALLLGTSALYLLLVPDISLGRLIPPFLVSFVMALAISVPIDSYFWQKPLWPELWGFYYNAILGSSSNWGVSPWHYYFTSALPRLLLNPLVPFVLIPVSLRHPATGPAARRLVIPSLLFVAIYSIQPHKEARFIFYVVPPLTAAAALGANAFFNRRTKSTASAIMAFALVVSVLASFVASVAMLFVSSLNYPGGEALAHLHELVRSSAATGATASTVVPVHADVLTCMTGVTLFGVATGATLPRLRGDVGKGATAGGGGLVSEQGDLTMALTIVLDKTEDDPALLTEGFWTQFDYLLMEDPDKVKGGEWAEEGVVQAFGGIELLTPSKSVESQSKVVGRGSTLAHWRDRVRNLTRGWWVGPRMVPKIHILQRRKESERSTKAVNS